MRLASVLLFWIIFATQSVAQEEINQNIIRKSYPDKDIEVTFHDKDKRIATVSTFDKSGNLILIENYGDYKFGVKQGYSKALYPTGEIYWITDYKSGEVHGEFRVFYPTGNLKRTEVYKRGVRFKKRCYDENENEIPFFEFTTPATFPNGSYPLQAIFRKHVKNIHAGSMGSTTVLSLKVTSDSLTSLVLFVPNEYITGGMMAKIMAEMPKWNPASYDGTPFASVVDIRLVFLNGNLYLAENVPTFGSSALSRVPTMTIPTTPPPFPNRQRRAF